MTQILNLAELATLYFPDSMCTKSAVRRMRFHMRRDPQLIEALEKTGYRRFQRMLTPRQYRILVRYWGEPE